MSAGAAVAIVAFIVLFGLVIWAGTRQAKALDEWLQRRIDDDGWVAASIEELRSQADWRWLASVGKRRDVTIQHLAADPASRRSAFTLVTRRYGERAGAARHAGVGVTTKLPHEITPPLLATPIPSGGLASSLGWILGLDLPEVDLGDRRLSQRWTVWSDAPQAAAELLVQNPTLGPAFDALFEEVWNETRFQYLVVELNGDAAALIAGPKTVGRQPFEDLGNLARTLVDRLH